MKNIIFSILFILIFSNNNAISQTISLKEIIDLRTKSIGEIDESLSSKKWLFEGSEYYPKSETKMYNYIYDRNHNFGFKALFSFLEVSNKKNNYITLQVNDIDLYNFYISEIKKLNSKLIDSYASNDNNSLFKIYRSHNLTFIIESKKKNNNDRNYTTYLLTLMNNEHYNSVGKETYK